MYLRLISQLKKVGQLIIRPAKVRLAIGLRYNWFKQHNVSSEKREIKKNIEMRDEAILSVASMRGRVNACVDMRDAREWTRLTKGQRN